MTYSMMFLSSEKLEMKFLSSKYLPYGLAWNTVVMSGMVLQATTWKF